MGTRREVSVCSVGIGIAILEGWCGGCDGADALYVVLMY